MTKDEACKYYANKIVEDGIRTSSGLNNIIDLGNYGNMIKYKEEILERIYKDERVADVNIDTEGNVDMIFYTDFCPYYYEEEESNIYNNIIDTNHQKARVLEEFAYYYTCNYLLEDNSYISVRNLINRFINRKESFKRYEDEISNFLKKSVIESGFVDRHLDNIDVYVTPKNYKEFEKSIMKIVNQLEYNSEEEFE